jgi:hypothetical protein
MSYFIAGFVLLLVIFICEKVLQRAYRYLFKNLDLAFYAYMDAFIKYVSFLLMSGVATITYYLDGGLMPFVNSTLDSVVLPSMFHSRFDLACIMWISLEFFALLVFVQLVFDFFDKVVNMRFKSTTYVFRKNEDLDFRKEDIKSD